MPSPAALSTRTLLTCAAIGVATGLVGAAAGYFSIVVSSALPIAYGLILGSHVLPGVIAQAVLRRPGVALIAHVLAALISSAFAPLWLQRYIGAALLIGLLQEGITALSRYRSWAPWRFLVGSAVVGVALAVPTALAVDAASFAPWAFIVYIVLFIVGPVLWTLAGLALARALRRAGVTEI